MAIYIEGKKNIWKLSMGGFVKLEHADWKTIENYLNIITDYNLNRMKRKPTELIEELYGGWRAVDDNRLPHPITMGRAKKEK